METSTTVEIFVKPEPMDTENAEESHHNGHSQETDEFNEEEVWIKPDPHEDESQDSVKEDDHGTGSETETTKAEDSQGEGYNRNRQPSTPSPYQIHTFLDFLSEHRDLANCALRGIHGRAKAHQLWDDLTNILNAIDGGCTKTTHQWQRVWSDKKYLTKKAVARLAAAAKEGVVAPALSLQDEKIVAIIGDGAPTKSANQKLLNPETKLEPRRQSQELLVLSVTSKRVSTPAPLDMLPKTVVLQEPVVPSQPDIMLQPDVSPQPDILLPPDVSPQPDVSPHLDDPLKPDDPLQPNVPPQPVEQQQDVSPPPLIPSPSTQQRLPFINQRRKKPRTPLDACTSRFLHLEEERLRTATIRNLELEGIRSSLQDGTAELAGIRRSIQEGTTELTGIREVMQEMLGLMKQLTERNLKK